MGLVVVCSYLCWLVRTCLSRILSLFQLFEIASWQIVELVGLSQSMTESVQCGCGDLCVYMPDRVFPGWTALWVRVGLGMWGLR